MNRSIIIIPNEHLLDAPIFRRFVKDTENHGKKVKEFSDMYNLGLTAEKLGLSEDDYANHTWQVHLTMLGHVVLNRSYFVTIYLPQYLSHNQKEWFIKNLHYLESYSNLIAISIIDAYGEEIKRYGTSSNVDKCAAILDYVNNSISYEDNLRQESEAPKR